MNYKNEIRNLIIEASKVADRPLTDNDFEIVHQSLNHIPLKLPKGKMAVYTFLYKGKFLKIGQANFKSNARYQSQHYNLGSARSTLAKILTNDPEMTPLINQENLSDWIKKNCERFDVIINAELGKNTLNFIEGLLHYKYNPKYEGWKLLYGFILFVKNDILNIEIVNDLRKKLLKKYENCMHFIHNTEKIHAFH